MQSDLRGADEAQPALRVEPLPIGLGDGVEDPRPQHGIDRRVIWSAVRRAHSGGAREAKQSLDADCRIALAQRPLRPRCERLVLEGDARRPAYEAIGMPQVRPRSFYRPRILPAMEGLEFLPQLARGTV